MYYIYHIIGRKVGCTQNPKRRIEIEQKALSGTYEILLVTSDIQEASEKEKHFQRQFGYQVEYTNYETALRMANKSQENLLSYIEKPILQFSKKGEFLAEWKSTYEASRQLTINSAALTHCLKGRQKTSGGFKWQYKQ